MNKDQIAFDDFYAKDVFPEWIKLVKKAKTSITIFSPFLNEAISTLLGNAIDTLEIRIITRLDAEYLCGNINKIKVLIAEMEKRNLVVYDLDFLHAKILLVDNIMVSIGSQNFTNEGRENKEASFAAKCSFQNSKFLLNVKDWEKQGKRVSKEYLTKLYESIQDECEKYSKKRLKLKKKIEKIKENLNRQERDYTTRGDATVTRYFNRQDLKCAYHEQLTSWKKTNMELEKGAYYPIFNRQTNRIIFGRVNKRNISFIINGLDVGVMKVRGEVFDVRLNFSMEKKSNINIVFKPRNKTKEVKIKYFFNGTEFILRSRRKSKNILKSKMIKDLESMVNFPCSLFIPAREGIQVEHIAENFATEEKYRLDVVKFQGIIFLRLKSVVMS